MTTYSAKQIADFFLSKGSVSPKKLQKLVYYAYSWAMALLTESENDEPVRIFEEPIEAWVHGPVVPVVYQRFKSFQFSTISDRPSSPPLTDLIIKHLDEIIDVYGDHHAFVLERMSHKTTPWLKARGDIPADSPSTNTILIDDMKNYFKQKKLESGQQQADQRA